LHCPFLFILAGDATLCLVTIWHRFGYSLAASSQNVPAFLQYIGGNLRSTSVEIPKQFLFAFT